MRISREDFWNAAEGISEAERSAIWQRLGETKPDDRPRFDFTNTAYYFGAFVVISAMGWFMNRGWEQFGGGDIFAISIVYATCFLSAGWWLWHNRELRVPGGLLGTLAVWMIPLAVYGLERQFGLWPQSDPGTYRDYHVWVKGSWFLIEASTIIGGLILLRFIKFPFITFPIAFTLWYMSMDLTPLIFRKPEFSYTERLWVSAVFGLVMLAATYLMDIRGKSDYAFWGYLFGLAAFWGGLSLMDTGSELRKFGYCMINVGLIVLAVFLRRRIFAVFGALGVYGYLGRLAWEVFPDSTAFPFVLSLIGLGIIGSGYVYQKNSQKVESCVSGFPTSVLQLRPQQR